MATAIIPLKDIIVDSEEHIDLASLPEQEAITLIKKSYGFLSSELDISIKNGMAVIRLSEEKGRKADEALEWYNHAVRLAEKGEYKRAIRLFEKVLNRLPNHTEARRNLAMTYLESGDKEEAKNLLVQTLKLNPKDAWSYVLLGNIYSKHENNFDAAGKWYRKAFELNPTDPILLTNYGALMVESGNIEQATEFFERAIEAQPTYPNPYYALALLNIQQEKPEHSIQLLDVLFASARPVDIRSVPLYKEARTLYLQANQRVATKSYESALAFLQEKKKELEEKAGYPIEIIEDNSLEHVSAVTQMAWKHGREHHIVKYRNKTAAITPHLLAHELVHISLEDSARKAGRNRIFMTTAQTREHAIRSISDDIYKLRDIGYREDQISNVVQTLISGLANQLFNIPLDMVIEHQLAEDYPLIRSSQFVSLHTMQLENLSVFTNPEIKKLTPPPHL